MIQREHEVDKQCQDFENRRRNNSLGYYEEKISQIDWHLAASNESFNLFFSSPLGLVRKQPLWFMESESIKILKIVDEIIALAIMRRGFLKYTVRGQKLRVFRHQKLADARREAKDMFTTYLRRIDKADADFWGMKKRNLWPRTVYIGISQPPANQGSYSFNKS